MARIMMDGFEYGLPVYGYVGTTSLVVSNNGTPWTFTSKAEHSSYSRAYRGATANSRSGNYALRFYDYQNYGYGTYSYAVRSFDNEAQEIFARVYFYSSGSTSEDTDIIRVLDNADGVLLRFRIDKSNHLLWVYDENSQLIGTTPSFNPKEWIKLEFRLLANTSGVIEVWLNDMLVVTHSGNTVGTKGLPSKLQIGYINTCDAGGNYYIDFDDIAINDTTGSVNNGRCGSGKILPLAVKGDGAYSDFTPSTGVNYENVDEIPPDDDTTYNLSEVFGNKDTYTYEDLVADRGLDVDAEITAVSVEHSIRWATEPSSASIILKNANGEHESQDIILSSSYSVASMIFETNPVDNAPWTTTSVDNMEFGVKHKQVT